MNEQNTARRFAPEHPHIPETRDSRNNDETGQMPPQLQGRLLHMTTQLEQVEAQLAHLVDVAQSSRDQVDVLTRHLTGLDAAQPIRERLAELISRAEAYQEQLDEIASTTKKLSRTQFKSNTLAESKEQQIAAALETLQEIVTRREQKQETQQFAEQERVNEIHLQARGELAAELLPVLDGLEMALDSGRSLLERRNQQYQNAQRAEELAQRTDQGSLQRILQQLRTSLTKEPEQPQLPPPPRVTRDREMEEHLDAWLDGLDLVRDRFVAVLASEGIEAIPALHQPFDPKLHVAVSAEPRTDVPPGTVVEVLRRGYRQRGRVLRFAEVVVARSEDK